MNGAELIGELMGNFVRTKIMMPLPAKSSKNWTCQKYSGPDLQARITYIEKWKTYRIKLFQCLMKQNNPRFIPALGKTDWNVFRILFPKTKEEEGLPQVMRLANLILISTPLVEVFKIVILKKLDIILEIPLIKLYQQCILPVSSTIDSMNDSLLQI